MQFKTFDDAYAYLARSTNYEISGRFPPAEVAFKLERVAELMERLGRPERAWRSVHIAGTKGKGSTAAMAESILRRSGLRTGLYTSPHVVHLRERIQCDGRWITGDEFAHVMGAVAGAAEEMRRRSGARKPTFFEMMTAAAFLFFREVPVDVGVVEVGLGGRLDATNVLAPAACAITHIGLDHITVLGNSIPSIAREKAGIIKDGVPVVTACAGEALETISRIAEDRKAPLEIVGRDILFARKTRAGDSGEAFSLETPLRRYEDLRIAFPGLHQVSNAALAVRLAELAAAKEGNVGEETVRVGLREATWEARIQLVSQNPRVVLDCAHNVDSALALVATLREKFQWNRLILVMGISSDKDYDGFLRTVLPICDSVIATAANSPRALTSARLGELVRALGCADCAEAPDAGEALRQAFEKAAAADCIVISGSFYLAGEAREILIKRKELLAIHSGNSRV